jgi:hypothetical protein
MRREEAENPEHNGHEIVSRDGSSN